MKKQTNEIRYLKSKIGRFTKKILEDSGSIKRLEKMLQQLKIKNSGLSLNLHEELQRTMKMEAKLKQTEEKFAEAQEILKSISAAEITWRQESEKMVDDLKHKNNTLNLFLKAVASFYRE